MSRALAVPSLQFPFIKNTLLKWKDANESCVSSRLTAVLTKYSKYCGLAHAVCAEKSKIAEKTK